MSDSWNPIFYQHHPSFAQLLPLLTSLSSTSTWPLCATLNAGLPAHLTNANQKLIQFTPQDASLPYRELYYEQRIFDHGLVSTRANWHDFFNALIWQRYPRLKLAINERHVADIKQLPHKARTPQRDALTIFDESGVIIVSSQRMVLQNIIDFNWQKLFQYERQAWYETCACFVVGHALLEKFLTPYVGLTTHAVLVQVKEDFFNQSFETQRFQLDYWLAEAVRAGRLYSPQVLSPFPVLGVPEWWSEQNDLFYANTHYFRPKRRERAIEIFRPNPHVPV